MKRSEEEKKRSRILSFVLKEQLETFTVPEIFRAMDNNYT